MILKIRCYGSLIQPILLVREIPIDEHGRMYVNYYGPFQTFYYLPYMYCFDPEMLPPEYWEGKVAFVGCILAGFNGFT